METFKHHAARLIVRGIRVIILEVGTKAPDTKLCPHGARDHTSDPLQIALWDKSSPDGGVGAVATPDTVFFVDDDNNVTPPELVKDCFTVETGSGKHHYYFRQTAETKTWRNKSFKDAAGHEAWSFRTNIEFVVGPGSIHPDTGKPYKIVNDVPISEPSEAFLAWLRPQMELERRASVGQCARALHKDFTPAGFLDYYGLKYKNSPGSDKYHVHYAEQGCPVAGRVHMVDNSKKPREIEQCTFMFGDGPPGFECLSGCCYGKGFKDAVSAILKRNHKLKPFPVWEGIEERGENVLESASDIEISELLY